MISQNDSLGGGLDSSNVFEVRSGDGGKTVLFNSESFDLGGTDAEQLDRSDALNLAAWLVAIADPERKAFDRLFAEIRK
jgi:hypothetical protein